LIVALIRFFGGRAWAVEDCDDDDQSASIGSGELRRIGVYRDMAEDCVAVMATAARAVLFVSSSSLISIAGGDGGGRLRQYKLGMKKSSIDGKCYLVYLWALLVYKIVVLEVS
jgi:hypothetical protein